MHSDRPDYITDKITLFLSGEHPCSYLSGKFSQEIYAQPLTRFDNHIYSQLIYSGFRRSGELVYRPHCKYCSECIPVRIPVDRFKLSGSKQRVVNRNCGVDTIIRAPEFRQDQFDLYQRYVNSRHPNGGMDNPEPREYMEMLTCHWTETVFVEFRENSKLLAVAVMDRLEDGYSAVYTYFDPSMPKRSLGKFAILWQIEECRRSGLPFLYLGYYIRACTKMNYKTEYRPIEQFVDNRWEDMPDEPHHVSED